MPVATETLDLTEVNRQIAVMELAWGLGTVVGDDYLGTGGALGAESIDTPRPTPQTDPGPLPGVGAEGPQSPPASAPDIGKLDPRAYPTIRKPRP
jgi:hypothetical protein